MEVPQVNAVGAGPPQVRDGRAEITAAERVVGALAWIPIAPAALTVSALAAGKIRGSIAVKVMGIDF